MTSYIRCPYCDEQLEVAIDWSLKAQQYIEDCQVCCSPMVLTVEVIFLEDGSQDANVSAQTTDT